MAVITVRQALNEAYQEEMRRDPDIILMGCDIGVRGGSFGVTLGLYEEFGDRVMDTPISELGFMGMGVGAAMSGLRPVVEVLYSDWITLPLDQIFNSAAKLQYMYGPNVTMPLTIRTANGGAGGSGTQHSQSLEAWFNHMPGLKVVAPVEPYDVKGILKSAIRDDNPVLFFDHKGLFQYKGEIPDGAAGQNYTVPIGKAAIRREGTDVTLIAYSRMALHAKTAAAELEKEGISCEVIDLITLAPLDYETVMNSIAKTHRVVVCQEAPLRGGLAGDIVATIIDKGFDLLDAPPKRVGALNIPVPFNRGLEAMVVPDVQKIKSAVKSAMSNQ